MTGVQQCVCGHPFADHVDGRCAGYVPVEVDAHDPQCSCTVRVESGPVVTITMTEDERRSAIAKLARAATAFRAVAVSLGVSLPARVAARYRARAREIDEVIALLEERSDQ